MFSQKQYILRPLCTGLLAMFSMASVATIPDIAPGTPFTPLQPAQEHAVTTQQIMSNLLRGHYERKRLDNAMSSQVLDTLLDDIDSTRSYMLASDIAEFEQYRTSLDEALSRGNMAPAFSIYNRFEQRVAERLSFLLNELSNHVKDYNYKQDETLELDREDAPWATTAAELDELWPSLVRHPPASEQPGDLWRVSTLCQRLTCPRLGRRLARQPTRRGWVYMEKLA